jgi:transposase
MNALARAHDAAVQMIDTSIVRLHQHGACITRNRRQSMGRSRGGLTSKIHAVVDTNGLPVRLALTAGEAHDNRLARCLLSRLKSGSMLLADRGYDADWIRAIVTKRSAWANIPPRSNRNEPICFSPHLYRARNQVERFFNRIKQCRRTATRYDKLAANYLAFIQLASIRLWLRFNEYTPLVTTNEYNAHQASRMSMPRNILLRASTENLTSMVAILALRGLLRLRSSHVNLKFAA